MSEDPFLVSTIMEQVLNDVLKENSRIKRCPVVSVWEDLCKVAAEECLTKGNSKDAAFLLSECHAVYLRHKSETSINYQLRRASANNASNPQYPEKRDFMEDLTPETRRSLVGISSRFSAANGEGVIERLKDLPQEWTIVQVTSAFDVQFAANPKRHLNSCPPTLYVTRMECGPDPTLYTFRVDLTANSSVPAGTLFYPKSSRVTKSFLEELKDIVADDVHIVKHGNKFNLQDYWTKRSECGQRMKVLLNSIENRWLRGWKSLFLGKLFNAEDEVQFAAILDSVLSSSVSVDLTPRSHCILSLLVGAMPNLQPAEVHRVLRDILPDSPSQEIFDLMDAIEGIRETCSKIKPCRWKRHPVILILDKRIEGIPWEMLPTLEGHPYSRVPSLHFAHCLSVERYKIKEAYVDTSQGYYVVNPDGSLPKTEERVMEYLERRPEIWRGKKGVEISHEEFLEVIKEHEVILYSGHGSGSQYMQDMQHHSQPLRAVMLLMGCGSASVRRLAAHLDPWGAVYQHLLGRSPCVIGMLWPVTDADCDAVTMKLLDVWLGPAQDNNKERKDNKSKTVGMETKGIIQFSSHKSKVKWMTSEQKAKTPEELLQACGDLLRALTESRYAATLHMTAAAMVAYGMPVRATKAEDMASLLRKLNNMSLK